jgi:hypothetical protein
MDLGDLMSKAMQRARRSARAVLHGDKILEFIQKPVSRKLLVAAAESGSPPVTAISKELEKIARKDIRLAPVKQFAGLCVRAVLEEEGFEVAETGVRLSQDTVFRSGSVYRKIQATQTGISTSLLDRFLDVLNSQELEQLARRLDSRPK